jgi:hypothetical protein|tara:strand:+ start:550 stop:1026 length:477 start_codon:yes stop_codon:yes gene_type:complete
MLMKLKVYIIMFAAFAMFAGLAYWYYKDTQKALQTYAQNQATLESSLSMQKQATESLRSNIKIMTETITKLNDDFADSRKNVAELQNIFTKDKDGKKRDFGELTIAEPEVIQKEINKGSDEVFRCIELLTGDKPKQGEADAQEYIDCTTSVEPTNSLQ